MKTHALSQAAVDLFRLHIERDGIRVDDANREAHRELAAAVGADARESVGVTEQHIV